MFSIPPKDTPAQRQARYRNRLRAKLIAILGGRCVECGTEENLEPDHLQPREWRARDVWAATRNLIYLREAKEGKVVLRCRSCNASKGKPFSAEDLETIATF